MLRPTPWVAMTLVTGALGMTAVLHGQVAKTPTLTAMDYLEIQQLVARYPFALDTGADHGYTFADLFTEDGVFTAQLGRPYEMKGREQLAGLAWQHRPRQGPLYVRNFHSNVYIEPSPDGATGRSYGLMIDVPEDGHPAMALEGGHYEDIYVKTTAGWRFKKRTFIPSKPGSAAEASASQETGR